MLSNGGNTMTVDTKELVTTIAYLIGVKKHIVEQCFDAECHDTLQKLYAHKGGDHHPLSLQAPHHSVPEVQENRHRNAV